MSDELLLKNGIVVTVDDRLGDLQNADVLVRDGVIVAVGSGGPTASADAEVIDCKGRLVIPGLVDTHRHVWQGAIGALTPQMTGAGYGPAVLNGISTSYKPEDIYAGALWGALQALDAGITTIADWAHNLRSAEHAHANLRGLQESRIRGYFLYGGPGPTTDMPNPPHPLDARRMRDEHFPKGVNGRMLTDKEFALIARSKGTISLTPSTDMLMQFGTFPAIGPALQRGIRSGFGVDTICSCGTDIFSEMRLALAAERSRANAPALSRGEQVPTVALHQRDMLRLATIDGARVWKMEHEVGSLTPGKQADITVIDMRSPHLDGYGDSIATMVLGAGPADVETVIVGGDVVKRQGQLVGEHVEKARELMLASRDRIRKREAAAGRSRTAS